MANFNYNEKQKSYKVYLELNYITCALIETIEILENNIEKNKDVNNILNNKLFEKITSLSKKWSSLYLSLNKEV